MIDLSKSVFVDVGNQFDTFIAGKLNTLSQQTVSLVQGDILALHVYLRNVTGDNTTSAETLMSDEKLIVGVKEVASLSGDDTGLFVYQETFTAQTDSDGDTYYEGVIDLTNVNLTTALTDKRNAECLMEFSVQKNDDSLGKTFQGSLVVTSEINPSGSSVSLGGGSGLSGGDSSLLSQQLNSLRAEVGTWSDYLQGKALALEETEYTLPDSDGDGIVDSADVDTLTAFAVNGYYPLYLSEEASNADSNGDGTSHTHVFSGITYYMPNGLGNNQYHGNYNGNTQGISGVSNLVALASPSVGVSLLMALASPSAGASGLSALASPSVGVTNLSAVEQEPQLQISNAPSNLVAITQPQESVSSLVALIQPIEGVSGLSALTQPGDGVTNLEAEEEEVLPFTVPASSFRTLWPASGSANRLSYVGTNGKYYVMDGAQGYDEIVDNSNNALTGITGMIGRYHVIDGDGKVYGTDPQFHPTNSRSGYNELSYLEGFEFLEGSGTGKLYGANGDGMLRANRMMAFEGSAGTGERITNANAPVYVEADFVPSLPVVTMALDANTNPVYTELDNIVWAKNTGNMYNNQGHIAVVTSEGKGYYRKYEIGTWNGFSGQTIRSYMVPIMADVNTEMTGIEQVSVGEHWSPTRTPCLTILKTDGSVWCMGENTQGQTGQGSATGTTTYPAQVIDTSDAYVTGVSKVMSSVNTNYALKNDGTVLFWGWNRYLVGGTGGTQGSASVNKATLMQANTAGDTLTDVEDISDEYDYGTFFFKKTDGTIWQTGALSSSWEVDYVAFSNGYGRAFQIV